MDEQRQRILHRALCDTAGEHGIVSDRARQLLDELVEEIAEDPRNADPDAREGDPYYRTVLVVEVFAPFSPYEGGLRDLSRAITNEEIAAVVVSETTENVTEDEAGRRLTELGVDVGHDPADKQRRHHDLMRSTTTRVLESMDALGKRMRLPDGPESPDLLALRRMHRFVVAVPSPRDPHIEVYADSEAEAEDILTRDYSRDDLLTAVRMRGARHIQKRATRRELARALVLLGPAWFDDWERHARGAFDEDYYDELDEDPEPDAPDTPARVTVADMVAHDAAVGLPGFTRVD